MNYEIKCITVQLLIVNKHQTPVNTVQMKIDNLNWVQLMDPGRVENLKNIFRWKLEPKSDGINTKKFFLQKYSETIYGPKAKRTSTLCSWNRQLKWELEFHCVHSKKKGNWTIVNNQIYIDLQVQSQINSRSVIIHLGSTTPFSPRLIELQEEVKPLYKIASCSFKRTSVQTIIENAGFKIDWCAFRIVGNSKDLSKAHGSEKSTSLKQDQWEPMAKSEVPERNYIDEFAIVIAIPTLILFFLVTLLSIVLCFYDKM